MNNKIFEWTGVTAAILYSLFVALNIGIEFIGFSLLLLSAALIGIWAYRGKHKGILLLQWEEALLDMNANYEDRVRSWKDAEAAMREGKIQEYVDGLVEKTKEEVEEAADKLGKLLFFPMIDPDKDKLH